MNELCPFGAWHCDGGDLCMGCSDQRCEEDAAADGATEHCITACPRSPDSWHPPLAHPYDRRYGPGWRS